MPNRNRTKPTIISSDRRLDDITESEWASILDRDEPESDDTLKNAVKIAAMESKLQAHERRIMTIEDYHMTIVEKLDAKIEADRERQMDMEKTMTRAVTTLEHLTAVVDKLATSNATTVALVQKHEAIGTAVVKLGSLAAVVIGGIWAVVKFLAENWPG